jgi:putative endopeptidase
MNIKKVLAFTVLFQLGLQSMQAQMKYIDPKNIDNSVKPGDDFYNYANGAWLKSNPIPPSKTRWGSFDVLQEKSTEALKDILQGASKSKSLDRLTTMVGSFYSGAMDSVAIEVLGPKPIQPYLNDINTIATKEAFLNKVLQYKTKGVGAGLFNFYVDQDDKNVNKYIPQLSQSGGTSLPDKDYYLVDNARFLKIREGYKSYVKDMFVLVGYDSTLANECANQIFEIEKSMAQSLLSRVELRDPVKTYNKISLTDLTAKAPTFNWQTILKTLGVKAADSILVNNPNYFVALEKIVKSTPLESWKHYLQWNIIKGYSSYLSNAFVDRQFKFSQILSGQKQITPRWQRMSNLTNSYLGELLGQLYVKKYFNANAKSRMLELVNNLQTTYAERIKKLDWMSDATKAKALGKLNTFVKKVGHPNKWESYQGVVINKNNFIESLRSCSQWGYNKMINKLGKPVDKTEWGMTPPTVNAYYNPSNNEIAFPAGILQFPFFDFGADDAVNYGGIGAVIGHEITHGFDDQGRQYDAEGNLNDWWLEEDANRFNEKANKVVDQFNGYTVLDTLHVNGKLTLGENIADLGGVTIAYEAFQKTKQAKENKAIDGFTPAQRFFLSWAQVWKNNATPETKAQLIVTDPHSPGIHRCNGPLSNFDAFFTAFNIQPGSKMYKPVNERIKIW